MYKHFVNKKRQECVEVSLCKGCIDDLEDYNPYVDANGETISIDRIIIHEVDQKHCNNTIIVQGGNQ